MAEVHEATFVIVGGGIAGVSCVEQITYLCPDEPVILISASSVVKSVTNLSQISIILKILLLQLNQIECTVSV